MRIPELTPLMTDTDQCVSYNRYASNPVQLQEYVQTYQLLITIEQGTIIYLGSGT